MIPFQRVSIPNATLGMNTQDNPSIMDRRYSTNIYNMQVKPTLIQKRSGFSQLGSNLPLAGEGREIFVFIDGQGTEHLIALTTTKAYEYDKAGGSWTDITPVSGDFTGSVENRWSYTFVTNPEEFANGGTAVVISNNTDGVFAFDGSTGGKFEALTLSTEITQLGNVTELCEFWNHLFLFNFSSSGLYRVNHVLYHDLVDATYANKGVVETRLTDSIGQIRRVKKLGYDLIIYSDGSITLCQTVNSTVDFVFPTTIYDCGILFEKGIASIAGLHFVVTSDKRVVAYQGGSSVEELSWVVKDNLFDFDTSRKYMASCSIDTNTGKIYIFLPQSEDYPVDYYAINYLTRPVTWESGKFGKSVMDMTQYNTTSDLACDSTYFTDAARDYCDDTALALFSCNDGTTRAGFPATVFITGDGYIYQLADGLALDDTETFQCILDTPELTLTGERSDELTRYGEFAFDVRSRSTESTCQVWYSTTGVDGTFTQITDSDGLSDTVVPVDTWTHVRFPCDILARGVIFRIIQEDSGDIQIRNRSVLMEQQGER